MTKVVCDTNIFISFLLTSNPTISKLFRLWESEEILICYSKETFRELKRALEYPKLKKYIAPEDKQNLLDKLRVSGQLHQIASHVFINLAISAEARYIVSGDKDLLNLKEVQGVKILSPQEAVKLLR